MHRKIILAILNIVLASSLFAAKVNTVYEGSNYSINTQGLEIMAAYGDVCQLQIEPIAAQSEAYLAGMPFSIIEPYVQYNAGDNGRQIAKWDIICNVPFKIEIIRCDSLTWDEDKSRVALPYILTFDYDFSYVSSGSGSADKNKTVSGTWSVSSESAANRTFTLSDISDDVSLNRFVGSVAGNIFFKFAEYMPDGTTPVLNVINDNDQTPSGNYSATVVIKISPEENATV